jgi:predicted RNA-binding protein YlxR (DUF448 family)
MCVSCREKFPQKLLMRLQCIKKELVHFTKVGRSFYLCQACIEKKDKRVQKALSARCKKKIEITDLESLIYG